MKKNVSTISDVAKLAKVSKSTVSRVINDIGIVKDETKLRVEKAMKTLSFEPNPLAQSMRKGTTYTIGIIIPDYANVFYATMYNELDNILTEHGFRSIICYTKGDQQNEKKSVTDLVRRNIDGIIMFSYNIGSEDSGFFEKLSKKVPIVLMDESGKNCDISCVYTDGYEAFYNLTTLLIKRNHKRIACISSSVYATVPRLKGYLDALKDNGIKQDRELIIPSDFSMVGGFEKAKDFLALDPRPTAIVSVADYPAIGMVSALTQQGIKIPEQIEVISFDNIEFSSFLHPTLTTIAQPTKTLAQDAVEILMKKIHNPSTLLDITRVALKGEIIYRETTRN